MADKREGYWRIFRASLFDGQSHCQEDVGFKIQVLTLFSSFLSFFLACDRVAIP